MQKFLNSYWLRCAKTKNNITIKSLDASQFVLIHIFHPSSSRLLLDNENPTSLVPAAFGNLGQVKQWAVLLMVSGSGHPFRFLCWMIEKANWEGVIFGCIEIPYVFTKLWCLKQLWDNFAMCTPTSELTREVLGKRRKRTTWVKSSTKAKKGWSIGTCFREECERVSRSLVLRRDEKNGLEYRLIAA